MTILPALPALPLVPWALTIWLALLVITLAWWFSLRPRSDGDWAQGMEVLPRAEIAGDMLHVRNYRNFSYSASGEPVHIELKLDGFTLGIAKTEAAKEHHSLPPEGEGRSIEIVVWTDDTDSALSLLVANGTTLLSPAHDFLEGKLRAAWISDPDGNPIQLVQRRR